MSEGISLSLRRGDMSVIETVEPNAGPPVVRVVGRHAVALCPACEHPSATTNGSGSRRILDVVRSLVVELALRVRRFVCENPQCDQRSFDERFEGIDARTTSERARAFFADQARGRATAAVARDLGVALHHVRAAVGARRSRAHWGSPRRLGRHLAIDECCVAKGRLFATVFSNPERGIVIDVTPGREASSVWACLSRYRHQERAAVQVVTIDCHAGFRKILRTWLPNALIVADSFHLHQRVQTALAEVRRGAARRRRGAPDGDNVGIYRTRRPEPDVKVVKGARWALARAGEKLDADDSEVGRRQRAARDAACAASREVGIAYQLKEAFRATMKIARTGDVALFEVALDILIELFRSSGLRPFLALSRSFTDWRGEIVAYAITGGASNAFAEALNHLIKNQKRQAHGYGSWFGFRGQIMWVFGPAVNPETGEIRPWREIPRGEGARWVQPEFA